MKFFLLPLLIVFLLAAASPAKKEEKDLVQSLKASSTNRERQPILFRLYRYYKEKKISGLELSYLLKLIDVQKLNRDFAGLEASFHDLGRIYENKKDYLRALDYLFGALVYSKTIEKGKSRSGYIFLNISEILSILNRRELAKKYLKKALDSSIRDNDEDLKASVLGTYGKLYYEDGDYANALKFINLSLKTGKGREKSRNAIPWLYGKALILLKIGEKEHIAEVMALLKNAVEMGLKNRWYNGLLPVMSEYIEKLIVFKRFSEARKYLDKIDDIYAPYYPYYFFYCYLEALYFEKKGEMKAALNFYRKAGGKLEEYFSGLNIRQYASFSKKTGEIYSGMIEFYLEMYNRTGSQRYIEKAVYFSEVKNAYIYDLIALENGTYFHFNEEKQKLEKDFLKCNKKYLYLLKQGDKGDRKSLSFYENKLERLKRQHEELTGFILESPVTCRKYEFKDFNIPLIREKLKPHQLVIKYVVLNESSYAFCIGRDSLEYWKLTGGTREILDSVEHLTEPLDDFTDGRVDYLRVNYNLPLARRLYDILVKDIRESHESVNEVFIIPDRELFKLPFEALVTGFNEQALDPDIVFSEYSSADYLIEKFTVSYFFSLFHFLKESKPLNGRKWIYTITAFGSPVMVESMFHPLPSSKREVLSIRSIFGNEESRVFLGNDFNRETFEAYAPYSRILHIATHFVNNIDYPQNSALLFSPSGDAADSPFYYAHEIFKLRLNAELVVLSACESSEKRLLGLQGLRGITASFRHSGVRSLIVSMWPVDERSSGLIPIFYRQYIRDKSNPQISRISISPALRAAKLQLMKRTALIKNGLKISFSHPFLWANYILYNFR